MTSRQRVVQVPGEGSDVYSLQLPRQPPDVYTLQLPREQPDESTDIAGADHGAPTIAQSRRPVRERCRRAVWGLWTVVVSKWLALPTILVAQAVEAVRLARSNTAFADEALYLTAGHAELDQWLNHVPAPQFQTYFSGAPVLYPPIGAIADSIGGLFGARMLSFLFIAGATVVLHDTTRRLFDRTAAFFAAAIFASLGPTQFLSAFSTYDPMALFLMTLAAWAVTVSAEGDDSTRYMVLAAVAMTWSDVAKYATLLFDFPILGLALAVAVPRRGWKSALVRVGSLTALTAAMVGLLLLAGGPLYMVGITSTTLARGHGTTPVSQVLSSSWTWVGAVAVIAAIGVVLRIADKSARDSSALRWWGLAILAGAVLLAPANQARIHTLTSLHKHVDFGAWFAAIVAGYALARIVSFVRCLPAVRLSAVRLAIPACVAVAILGGLVPTGVATADYLYHEWADSTRLVAALRPYVRPGGNYLVEDDPVPEYYLRVQATGANWRDTWYDTYTPRRGVTLTGDAAFTASVEAHQWQTIVLDFGATPATDRIINAAIGDAGGYHLVAKVPANSIYGHNFYLVWSLTEAAK